MVVVLEGGEKKGKREDRCSRILCCTTATRGGGRFKGESAFCPEVVKKKKKKKKKIKANERALTLEGI